MSDPRPSWLSCSTFTSATAAVALPTANPELAIASKPCRWKTWWLSLVATIVFREKPDVHDTDVHDTIRHNTPNFARTQCVCVLPHMHACTNKPLCVIPAYATTTISTTASLARGSHHITQPAPHPYPPTMMLKTSSTTSSTMPTTTTTPRLDMYLLMCCASLSLSSDAFDQETRSDPAISTICNKPRVRSPFTKSLHHTATGGIRCERELCSFMSVRPLLRLRDPFSITAQVLSKVPNSMSMRSGTCTAL